MLMNMHGHQGYVTEKEYIYLNSGDTPAFSQLKDDINF